MSAVQSTMRNTMSLGINSFLDKCIEDHPDGICVLDEDQNVIYANASANVLIGQYSSDFMGKKLPFVFNLNESIKVDCVNKISQVKILNIQAEVCQWKSRSLIMVRFEDVTSNNFSCEISGKDCNLFNQFMDNINEVFWMTSLDCTEIYYVNQAYETIWGRDRQVLYDSPISWMDAIHPDDRDRVRKQLEDAVEENNIYAKYRIILPDGTVRWLRDRAFQVFDQNGSIVGLAGIAEDITEQHDAKEKLLKSQNELAHYSRLYTSLELVASISHELNQPLTSIQQYAAGCLIYLQDDKPKEFILEGLKNVIQQSKRAGDIINHLKEFLRKGRQNKKMIKDLGEPIHNVITLLNTKLITFDINLKFDLKELDAPVYVDRIQIEQVLLNIINNAISAIKSADPEVREIEMFNYSSEEYLVITIKDSGAGLSSEMAEKVFDPFYTTKNNEKNMGMGLCISKSIIEAHGGKITLVSKEGQGCSFSIWLPIPNSKSGLI